MGDYPEPVETRHSIPQGFRFAGVHCGVKRNPNKQDLSLIVADRPSVAAGGYTANLFSAAPVQLDRERTPSRDIRIVVANSGNANACTGDRGLEDARQMAALAAKACGARDTQVLVLSTGIIGEPLPMERIQRGIELASAELGRDAEHVIEAARGIMTTDSSHKLFSRGLEDIFPNAALLGLAKGAAMIGPRMATMLGVLLTDVTLDPTEAQDLLSQAVERTFNCISVEGHMSTNDTVLLLANGEAAASPLSQTQRMAFAQNLEIVCEELARAIPSDGEGATHLIVVSVRGCKTDADARRIAETVSNSPLVKTAITGADPNWGRIVSAAGYAGVPFDVNQVTLDLNGYRLFQAGAPVRCDSHAVSHSIRDQFETRIDLDFSQGDASIRFWTSDLTAEYIRLNADYHT
ncbi:MAG: bifunctional glutamate N-acetyltransferase/amino-acid acetyltransferase ArgJ [Planctomycetota bacterium]|nr:bifunctional glutamate N-acetyltransferase/amino-acid acetyltransferase ArgJ [Planctomycetota bacterium]